MAEGFHTDRYFQIVASTNTRPGSGAFHAPSATIVSSVLALAVIGLIPVMVRFAILMIARGC